MRETAGLIARAVSLYTCAGGHFQFSSPPPPFCFVYTDARPASPVVSGCHGLAGDLFKGGGVLVGVGGGGVSDGASERGSMCGPRFVCVCVCVKVWQK